MSEKKQLRLAHLIAKRGLASRREAERWIEQGRVTVDGLRVTDPANNVDPEVHEVRVDGDPLPEPESHLYLALNKPKGILSTFKKDREKGPTLDAVVDVGRRLFPAGRLDRDSTGLLILTTDGAWANRVMHPRYEKEKEYMVRVRKVRPTPAAKLLREASFTEDGREFRAAKVWPQGSYVHMILEEGRKRQIRRLAKEAGLEVRELIRIRIGPVTLGPLKPGRWRKLSKQEVRELGKAG